MKDYQGAISRIIDEYIPISYDSKPMNQQTEDALLLQELVDKATPKKPDKYVLLERDSLGFLTQGYCKKCGTSLLVKNNYCGHCGQKLDWSEND